MNRLVTLLIIALIAANPASEARSAVEDLTLKVAPVDRPFQRYLSTYNLAENERLKATVAAKFWTNSLSFRKSPVLPVRVGETLLRVDIRELKWKAESWEEIAQRNTYFRDDWIDPLTREALRTQSYSSMAVVRLDQFLSQTSVEPGYSKLLGLPPKLDDLKKLLIVQDADVKRLALNVGGSVLKSGVALHNRQLERTPTILGYFWSSRDARTNIGDQDVLAGGEALFDIKEDGGEFIFSLPNGLQGYYLADAKGNQIADVPPDIAIDAQTPRQDKRVRNAESCVSCHSLGINTFSDVVSKLIRGGKVGLYSKDKDVVTRVEDFFLAGLPIEEDQARYAAAVERAAGCKPAEASDALLKQTLRYTEEHVDLKRAAEELGVDKECASKAFQKAYQGRLLALVAGESIPRDSWENVYHEAVYAVGYEAITKGVKP